MPDQPPIKRPIARKPLAMRPSNNYAIAMPERTLRELDAAVLAGVQDRAAVFELTATDLGERSFGIFSGLARFLEQFAGIRFDNDALNFIGELVSEETLAYLQRYSFAGMISAYPEGEAFFVGSPVVSVEASFGQCLVLEGLLSANIGFGSTIATAVGHVRRRVRAQKLYELWGAHPEGSASLSAYSAHLAGADATDSVLAARLQPHVPLYDVPGRELVGALLGDEVAAFEYLHEQAPESALPLNTTQLPESVEHAIQAGNGAPFAVSLPLTEQSFDQITEVRAQLDEAGTPGTNILLRVEDPRLLSEELIDAIVRTDLQVDVLAVDFAALAALHPPVSFSYRLVEVENPETGTFTRVGALPGRKIPFREFGSSWEISREMLLLDPKVQFSPEWRRLHVPYVAHGKIVTVPDPRVARELARENLTLLPDREVPVVLWPEPVEVETEAVAEVEPEADLRGEERIGDLTRRILPR
jgi:nicotinate phosphoribosyltransferase